MQELTAIATNLTDMSDKFQRTVDRFNIEETGQKTRPRGTARRAA
jgi:hypothetical protein